MWKRDEAVKPVRGQSTPTGRLRSQTATRHGPPSDTQGC